MKGFSATFILDRIDDMRGVLYSAPVGYLAGMVTVQAEGNIIAFIHFTSSEGLRSFCNKHHIAMEIRQEDDHD